MNNLAAWTTTAEHADLSQPLIVEQEGRPVAVLLSIEKYKQLTDVQHQVTATEAQLKADRVIFGDLVGLALYSKDPVWIAKPNPLWRVPYRFVDGSLVKLVDVDAQSGDVLLTAEEREVILEKVEQLATSHVSA